MCDFYELLSAISEELQKSSRIDNMQRKNDDKSFNIFRVLGVQSKEVIICRFMGALFSPSGAHGLGDFPLTQFIDVVLKEKIPSNDLGKVYVELEEVIDGDRRVDIVVHIGRKVYPIEVKIWAEDQYAQLSDYYHYYEKHNDIDKIYYLTPYGWKPSKKSIQELDDKVIRCISFENDINKWLDIIKKKNEAANVNIFIEQFQEIILDMCKEKRQLENIMRTLKLDEKNFDNNNFLKATVAILNNKDRLTDGIILNYLQKSIDLPTGYVLATADEKSKSIDKNACLIVMKDDCEIAWICVETNLYIATRREKIQNSNLWKEGRENYVWQYLHPNGAGSKFPLRSLECIFEHVGAIDITELLEDIKSE